MSDHVSRLWWRWRAALTVGSLLLGYGAYVVPYGYWLTTRPVFGGALVNFLLALGSLYAFLYAWVYRVTLTDDTITVISVLGLVGRRYPTRIRLSRLQIAGIVRLPSAENPRIITFVPKSAASDTVSVYLRFVRTDEFFHQWCAMLPGLKPQRQQLKSG